MLKPESPYTILPIVTPETDDPATSGTVVNIPCAPTIGHDLIMREGGVYSLRPFAQRAGYVTLEALYLAEGNKQGWEEYRAYVEAFTSGKAKRQAFPKDKLPREVLRRQSCGEIEPEKQVEAARRAPPTTGKAAKVKQAEAPAHVEASTEASA